METIKNEVLLETFFSKTGDILYHITRNIITNEYSFYILDKDNKLKKKSKSFDGSFTKEKSQYEQFA